MASPAQQHKARLYLAGRIRVASKSTHQAPWGHPWNEVEEYVLDPIPGCKVTNHVTVTTWHDGQDAVTGILYACMCQFMRATGQDCAHVLAVRAYRTEA